MDIFANSDMIISEVINRVLNCRQLNRLYTWGEAGEELDTLYPTVQKQIWDESNEAKVVYLNLKSIEDFIQAKQWICQYRKIKDFIIYVPNYATEIRDKLSMYGTAYPLNEISSLDGYLFLIGVTFDRKDEWIPNDEFRVLAILHYYNEADILDRTIEYLLGQEVDIYLLDNWSSDESYEIACSWKEMYPKRVFLERFPQGGKTENYEWHEQLERTEEISKSLPYNWFIHYDADEIRMSPWKEVSLKQALYWIDRLGYNCVENTVIDFKITDTLQTNIFMQDTYFDFRHKCIWYDQLKTWKKVDTIDIKTSGGHTAKFKNPKPFPLKFLNKHYPLRGVEHARKKIFKERIPRFAKEKQEFGWHGHYDKYLQDVGLLTDKTSLLLWDSSTINKFYIPLFMECGLRWESDAMQVDVPDIKGKKIVVYGAGNIGRRLLPELAKENEIIGWLDKNGAMMPWMYCIEISEIVEEYMEFDEIIIAVKNKELQMEILQELKVYK